MNLNRWREYRRWHELFDVVCNNAGYYDNADLASKLCARTNRTRQEDFEGAKTKLRSWRTGKRVPRRGSFFVLSDMLEVSRDPELEARWHALYKTAIKKTHDAPGGDEAAEARAHPGEIATKKLRGWIFAAAATVLGAGLAIATVTSGNQAPSADLPPVNYNAYVRVPLGSSKLIHGDFLDCDGPVPTWQQMLPRIPSTPLGTFADGGLARKMVNDCGKEMVVRAVMFTGTGIGTEEVRLLDDFMKIDVVEAETGSAPGG